MSSIISLFIILRVKKVLLKNKEVPIEKEFFFSSPIYHEVTDYLSDLDFVAFVDQSI